MLCVSLMLLFADVLFADVEGKWVNEEKEVQVGTKECVITTSTV